MNTVKIDNKEYPCRVTCGAMVRFKRLTGKDVSEINPGDISDMMALMYCSVASACAHDKIPFEMEFLDFADSISPDDLKAYTSANTTEMDESQKKNTK